MARGSTVRDGLASELTAPPKFEQQGVETVAESDRVSTP